MGEIRFAGENLSHKRSHRTHRGRRKEGVARRGGSSGTVRPTIGGEKVSHKRSHRTHRVSREDELEEEGGSPGRFALPSCGIRCTRGKKGTRARAGMLPLLWDGCCPGGCGFSRSPLPWGCLLWVRMSVPAHPPCVWPSRKFISRQCLRWSGTRGAV